MPNDALHRHHGPQLAADLERLVAQQAQRRSLLRRMAWAGLGLAGPLGLVACGGGQEATETADSTTTTSGSSGSSACTTMPTTTEGPYPGDGTNGSPVKNALALAGIVRADIRSSVAGATGTAAGVPLVVKLKIVSASGGCATALTGRAIYLWHCNAAGGYSMYSSGITAENYLRGVQVTDANGEVTFTTIFPGCYSGRWPHLHFEVYPSLTAATDASSVRDYNKVSQFALPQSACANVYANASGYSGSTANLINVVNSGDNIFGSEANAIAAGQMASVTGNLTDGYVATLTIAL